MVEENAFRVKEPDRKEETRPSGQRQPWSTAHHHPVEAALVHEINPRENCGSKRDEWNTKLGQSGVEVGTLAV